MVSNPPRALFAWPQQAAVTQPVSKTKIYAHAKPTAAPRALFVAQVDSITWAYKLAPETINLPAKPDVPEIDAFEIALKLPDISRSVLRCIDKAKEAFSKAVKANHHIYDCVFTDSKNECDFVRELDASTEVVVCAKLLRGLFIPTPVGNYNPDWAVAFQAGKVKHVYFVAETKGSLFSMNLRQIEQSKIECARKFFAKITSDQVKYDVVDGYGKLMELVAS